MVLGATDVMRELNNLLEDIVFESGEDNESRILIKQYPELRTVWIRFVRTNNLWYKYKKAFPYTKSLLWRIFCHKKLNHLKRKVDCLDLLRKRRYKEYDFLKKLVKDY